jgi:ABC-type transporter Mla MlaB component
MNLHDLSRVAGPVDHQCLLHGLALRASLKSLSNAFSRDRRSVRRCDSSSFAVLSFNVTFNMP